MTLLICEVFKVRINDPWAPEDNEILRFCERLL